MELWAVSMHPINNPQICSLAIARHCLWQGLPLARSSIVSATLGNIVTSESFFIHMLTCHCPTLSLTVLADGSIAYSLFKFGQLAFLRLRVQNYTHLPLPDTVSDRVCRWLDRVWSLQLNFKQFRNFRLTIHKYTHFLSPDTVFDSVCPWLDRVFPMELWVVSILSINNPQICSLAIARHCLWQVCRWLDRVFSLQR